MGAHQPCLTHPLLPLLPSCLQRARRAGKEAAALSGADGAAASSGRPSRRAATAAQVAIGQTYAFEGQKGMDMSPPRLAEQSEAMRFMEAAALPPPARAHEHAQQQAAFFHGGAAQGSEGHEPAENGGSPTKKRRRADALPTVSPGAEDDASLATGGTPSAAAGAFTPGVPPEPMQPVDLGPFLELARGCETQEQLKGKLGERFPPTRGRSAANSAFRDLFVTLCPGQVFSVSGGLRHCVLAGTWGLPGRCAWSVEEPWGGCSEC